jgi:hypothetical protein
MSQKIFISLKFDDEIAERARKFMLALAVVVQAFPGAMQVKMEDDAGEVYLSYNYRDKKDV